MSPARTPARDVDGILVLDKPAGLSSNAALQQVRRLFRARKAGHTGSLDPLATGVLPVCLGEATKLSGYLLDANKRYRVTAAIGTRTSTGDAEGTVVETSDPSTLARQDLEAAIPHFTGALRQRPPMHSAVRHQGRRLYELAREGLEVEREARDIRILELSLLAFGPGRAELEVLCSKGTYIRTLVEDLLAAAGQCAHVAALRRLEAGPFRAADMVTLEQLAGAVDEPARDALLLPPLAALTGWPRVRVDAARADYLAHGQPVRVAGAPDRGMVAVVDLSGRLLGVGEIDPDGLVAPRRWMAREAVTGA